MLPFTAILWKIFFDSRNLSTSLSLLDLDLVVGGLTIMKNDSIEKKPPEI